MKWAMFPSFERTSKSDNIFFSVLRSQETKKEIERVEKTFIAPRTHWL